MKRIFAIILAGLAAPAVIAGLVNGVLVAAHVSGPFANTVYGLTPRRLWATMAVVLALAGVVIGGVGSGPSRQSFRDCLRATRSHPWQQPNSAHH